VVYAQFHRESADQMLRPHYSICQSPIHFAINEHHLNQRLCRHNLTHPAGKEGFEILGVKCPAIAIRSFPKTACRSSAKECFSATASKFVPIERYPDGSPYLTNWRRWRLPALPDSRKEPIARRSRLIDFIDANDQAVALRLISTVQNTGVVQILQRLTFHMHKPMTVNEIFPCEMAMVVYGAILLECKDPRSI